MWSGQDSADPQQLWGNPGHSQNAWANGGSNHGGMNYPSRQQQWPGQMSMPPAQQWGYPQQSTQWQMQQQQMGWPNTPNPGYGGYEEKKVPSNRGSGYAGYGYQVVPPSMAPQPQQQSWQGQRDVYQPRQQWDTPGRNSQSIGTWNPSGGGGGGGSGSGSSSQWQNDWQNVRESEGPGNASPGLNPNLPFDAWPGTGGEEANIMWRDPKPKKKIRDTGVQAWGDPTSQMDKILRWKEADYEEFQKGPNSSTWNQLHFPEDSIRGYCGTKLDFANAGGDISDPNVFALNNAFQRALATGLLPKNLSANKHHLDANLKLMINSLLSRMVKEEQAENELQHIQQLMTQGEVPSTVAQEYERIYADRESLKLEIQVMSDEIKEATQGFSWLHQWKNRNSNSGDTPDGLTAALQSLGIEDAPKIPNPAPWQEGPSATWNEPAPISINTDLERPSHLDESGALKPGGPQEFVPGKKWEWRDPAKVAEDPNATPGSVKPSFASPNWGNGSCDPWTEKPEKKSGSTEEASEK